MLRDPAAPAGPRGPAWAGKVRERFAHWRARYGPRTADFLAILLALAVGIGQLLSDPASGFPIGKPASWVVLFISAGALWWRRRWPVGVTLLGNAAFAISSLPMTAFLGLSTLAVQRRDRVLAGMAALTYLVMVGQPAIFQYGDPVSHSIGTVFTVGLFVVLGAYVGARRDLVASLRERAVRAESERELRAEQAKLGERARIAQEMHDVLAHKVSLIALHAGALELNPDSGPEQVERSAVLIRTTAREALEDLRGVLGVLRTDGTATGAELAPQPKLTDVRRLIDASRAAGVSVAFVTDGDAAVFGAEPGDAAAATFPERLGRTAYRVVQEGLTNVHKHARGAAATVRLAGEQGHTLQVSVTNLRPVAGRSLLPGSGAGLVGLRERVELAGGSLAAGRTPEGGWSISAELPWPVAGEPTGESS